MIAVLFGTLAIATVTVACIALVISGALAARHRHLARRRSLPAPEPRTVTVSLTSDTSAFTRAMAATTISSAELPAAGRRLAALMRCGYEGHVWVDAYLQDTESGRESRIVMCTLCGTRPPTLTWEGDYA